MNLNLKTVRWVAVIGLAVVLLSELLGSFPWKPRQGYGLVLLPLLGVAVAVVSLLLMPRAAGTLLRHRDLLIPFALLFIALQLLEWLSALSALRPVLAPSLPLHVFNLSAALSLNLLIVIGLWVGYATWMTAAILAFVRTGEDNPCKLWPSAFKQFWRVFVLELIGVGVVFVGTAVWISLIAVMGWFALVPMAVFGVAWNLATAAVLPVGFESEAGLGNAFRAGVRVSLAHLRQWWLLLLMHMVLLGTFIFFYSHRAGNTNVSWNVNVFWTGGYESDCRWYGKLLESYQTSKLPFVDTLLGLLFGAMAVAIKIAIVQRWKEGESPIPSVQPGAMPPSSDGGSVV